jgi:hypothetical protein
MIRRLPSAVLWIGATVVVVAASWMRLRTSLVGDNAGHDFWTYYVAAARALTEDGTPYAVTGYVYSPLVALVVSATLHSGDPLAWWNLMGVASGVVAVVATCRIFKDELTTWRAPVFVTVGALLLFWTWPVTLELFYGQSDLIVLAFFSVALLAGRRGRAATFGALIGMAGLVKTWPLFALVWVFRRAGSGRGRAVAAAAAVLVGGVIVFVSVAGPSFPSDWYQATRGNSVQPYLSYSAFGVGRDLFGQGTQVEPFIVSSWLRWTVTAVLGLWALVLGMLALVRPRDERLAFWHVIGCGLLVLPVSHWFYLIFLVPVAWIYVVRLLSDRLTPGLIGTALVVGVWWLLAFRTLDQGRGGYVTVVLATFVMLTVSVLRDASLWRKAPGMIDAREGVDTRRDDGLISKDGVWLDIS